jgi:hypothetical protein
MAGTRPAMTSTGSHMTQPQPPHDDEPESDADRRRTNIIILLFVVVLIGGGIWLVNAMIDARKAEECMESGRRNCAPIESPSR